MLSYFLTHQSFPEKNQIIKKKLAAYCSNGTKFYLLAGENAEARVGLMKVYRLTGSFRCLMLYLFACLPPGLTRAMLKAVLYFRK